MGPYRDTIRGKTFILKCFKRKTLNRPEYGKRKISADFANMVLSSSFFLKKSVLQESKSTGNIFEEWIDRFIVRHV